MTKDAERRLAMAEQRAAALPHYNLPPELLAFIEALPDDQLDALEQLYRVLAYGPPAEAAPEWRRVVPAPAPEDEA